MKSTPIKSFNRIRFIFILAIVSLSAWSCASSGLFRSNAPISRLEHAIEDLFDDPRFYESYWGVVVESLDNGSVVFQKNAFKMFIPASNMKLFTTAAALCLLGENYQYETTLTGIGEMEDEGSFTGDIIISGSGDPSFGSRYVNEENPLEVFEAWADSLIMHGIETINGNVIGNDNVFDDLRFGSGWEYDDLQYSYGAPISGLSVLDNSVLLTIHPAEVVGEKPSIEVEPNLGIISVINEAVTIDSTNDRLQFQREIGSNTIVVTGTIDYESREQRRLLSIDNPTVYAAEIFRTILNKKGITINGKVIDIDETEGFETVDSSGIYHFASYVSPPLQEIIKITNKFSQNLYAEQLLKTLGNELRDFPSSASGVEVIKEFLTTIGISPQNYHQIDGSGLSRHNLVMPVHIATLLKYMSRHKTYQFFYDSLPIAGIDGTIANRMQNTAAENAVKAKTGTLRYVKSLSGYVRTVRNEDYLVALIVNHYTSPTSTSNLLQDRLYELLANFAGDK